MPDPRAKRLRQVNIFLAAVAIVWVLWLIAGSFVTNDLVSILFQWVVTAIVGWRVFVLLHFQGEGTVEKVFQKMVRTKDVDDFTHNYVYVYLQIRLTNGKLRKVKFGTLEYVMENRVDVGTSMVKNRWSWTWVPIAIVVREHESSPPPS